MVFSSFPELDAYLRKDCVEASLNPVRFISVESMPMWVTVKKLLLSLSTCHLMLSEFCDTEDTTPNIRRLIAKIKGATDSICVLPLSEHLRISPQIAQSTIFPILTKEYPEALRNRMFRIYLPMYRMRDILQAIPNNDPRRKDSILFLDTGDEIDYSLTIIQNDLHVELSGNEIHGFRQYLRYWEKNPDKPLILHTSNAIYFEHSVFFDDVRVIVTSFDLIKYHYELPSLFQPSDGTEDFWNQLARVMTKEKAFQDACYAAFSTNRFHHKLFDHWKQLSIFHKWLLWMWTRLQSDNSYLTDCAKDASCIDDFLDRLFCDIIDYIGSSLFDDLYAQRKMILSTLQLPVRKSYWVQIEQLSKLDAIRVLTDLTAAEKETIFGLLQGREYDKQEEAIAILRNSYPALANYLHYDGVFEIGDFDTAHKDYFERYRWYKATNQLPKVFVNEVQSLAREQGERVYSMKARNFVVSEEYDAASAIIFVDGMGAEYLDYLASVLSKMDTDQYSFQYRAGFCNLPSTTEKNKDFLSNRNVLMELLDLDELKHGSNRYPNNIIHEMIFLDTLREKIESAFSDGASKVILTSDHGTSRLAVLIRQTEFDQKLSAGGRPIYKYGRYCDRTDIASELPTAIEYDGMLIFADYTRFEQKGAPIDEVHGGASMEEWLVPVITITKRVGKPQKKEIENRVVLLTEEVRIDSYTKMVRVELQLERPVIGTVSVSIRGKRVSCEKSGDSFAFQYQPVERETEVTAIVYSGTAEIGKISFAIIRPLAANKKFDI